MLLCRQVSVSQRPIIKNELDYSEPWKVKNFPVCGKPHPWQMRPQNCIPVPPAYGWCCGIRVQENCTTSGWLSIACCSCHPCQQTVGTKVQAQWHSQSLPWREQLKHQRNEQRVLLWWSCPQSCTTVLFDDFTLSACSPEGSKPQSQRHCTWPNRGLS